MELEQQFILSCYESIWKPEENKNVWLVRDINTNHLYIKKIVNNTNISTYQTLKNATIAGIPKIHHLIKDDDQLIVIEDYIHGHTLEQMFHEQDLPCEDMAVDYIKMLCNIVKSMHAQNPAIIHRDIKPANIMISQDNHLYLIDFNASREFQEGQRADTQLLGTIDYAAPEQFGFRQSDERADIFAIGIVFNQLLTGKHPKEHLTTSKYRDVISKCIQLDPDFRYQSVDELMDALSPACHEQIEQEIFDVQKRNPLLIPGFYHTSKKVKIISAIGYLFLLFCCFQLNLTDEGKPLGGLQLHYEQFTIFLGVLSIILFNGNYMNFHHAILKRFYKIPLIKYMIQISISIILPLVVICFLLLIDVIIWPR